VSAVLFVDEDGTLAVATSSQIFPPSTQVFYGGNETSDPEHIDVINLATIFTVPYRIRLVRTNSSLRLDGEGGAIDRFNATLWSDPDGGATTVKSPGTLTIINTDGDEGTGHTYVAMANWDADFAGFVEADGTVIPEMRILGASVIGDRTVISYPALHVNGTTDYVGLMEGVFFTPTIERRANGTATFSVDFDYQTLDGRIQDITADGTVLPDVLLLAAEQLDASVFGNLRVLYEGEAFTDSSSVGGAILDMSGNYVMLPMGPFAEEFGGVLTITDGSSGLVGSIAAGQ